MGVGVTGRIFRRGRRVNMTMTKGRVSHSGLFDTHCNSGTKSHAFEIYSIAISNLDVDTGQVGNE